MKPVAGSKKTLWTLFALFLALLLGAELLVPLHGKFGLGEMFGFWAWYSFASCVALILLTKGLGWVIRRPEDYYDR